MPVRSAILGATLAIVVIVATVTFGSSLNSLIGHPPLYGWNWNYALFSVFSGDEDLPAHITDQLLARDPSVTQFSGAYFSSAIIDGQRGIPIIGMRPGAPVQPPVLKGSDLRSSDQIVLGASTMAALHTHLGATVTVETGRGQTARLVVAGEATMPAIMGPGMGTGAVIDDQLIPAAIRNTQGNSIPGPQVFFVRTKGGDSPAALAVPGRGHPQDQPSRLGPAGEWRHRRAATRGDRQLRLHRDRPDGARGGSWRPARWWRSASPW